MAADDMNENSRWLLRAGSDDSAMAAGDKVLPPLSCGSIQQQALLHSLSCCLAGLCALLSMLDNFGFGVALLLLVIIWALWLCPWSTQRRSALPVALMSGPESQYLLQLGNGEQVLVQLQAWPFLHPRLGVLTLRGTHKQTYTLIGFFPVRDAVWRLWRLHLRQIWAERKAAPGPAD
ncbi:hypothetical protein [Acidithiobacillus concretivorus]|uniref:DUF2244 domain-containing protein n=1 Tax=Acidithiobacillus concretivorus TaxID=3063952 RepID=A0ABS5ZS99_9PROT|nr:hypothetical protein [Acidithiobacillus concretivorus]MBU2739429.1 hypothetical protein [Acidithiobacillus concretivorus]